MSYPILRRTLFPRIISRISSIHGLEHLPRRGPFIVAANHVSYLETVLLAILIVRHTRQRVYSLTKFPVWNFFNKLRMDEWLGMIPVHREPEKKGLSVDIGLIKLKQGHPIVIFPEGARAHGGRLLRGKTGVARLAFQSGVPVVPVGYLGPAVRTARETIRIYLHRARELQFHFGRPLKFPAPETVTRDHLEQATADVMQAIAALLGTTYDPQP